jgi:hypothetical protein
MTFTAILINYLLPAVFTLIPTILGWFGAKALASSASANKTTQAIAKVAQIGLTIVGDVWNSLSPTLQASFADGQLTTDEREEIIKVVSDKLSALDVGGTVSGIANALGLPLSGVIGTIAEWVINHLAKAHTASDPSVSAKAYPVQSSSSVMPVGVGSAR